MAISVVFTGFTSAADGSTPTTVSLVGATANDVCVILGVANWSSAQAPVPSSSGYTTAVDTKSIGSNLWSAVSWKKLGSFETSVSFSSSINSEQAFAVYVLRGVAGTSPVDDFQSAVNFSSTGQPDGPAITASGADAVFTFVATLNNDSSRTPPSGWSNTVSNSQPNSGVTEYVSAHGAVKILTGGGSSDPGAWSGFATGVENAIITIAFKPADVSTAITGNAITKSIGSVQAARSAAVTGNSLAASLGTLSVTHTNALTGAITTGAVGAAAATFPTLLTGASMTATTGFVTRSLGITGASSSAAVGTVVQALGQPLVGSLLTGSVGLLAPRTSVGVTGNAGAISRGTMTFAITRPGNGVNSTSAVGSVGYTNVSFVHIPIRAEIQKLAPSSLIELFEIDATNIGGSIYRFHNGKNGLRADITWNGQVYTAMPIEARGFEWNGKGQLPRPTLTVSNIMGTITALVLLYDDLAGCKVTRIRTLQRYLDTVNFPGGVNPDADPTAEFPREIYFVDRKSGENRDIVEFELAAAMDLAGIGLPNRQIIQNQCKWAYRSAECGYTGTSYFDTNDSPVVGAGNDVCGKRLSSCRVRFGQYAELPYGGFPAAGLVKI